MEELDKLGSQVSGFPQFAKDRVLEGQGGKGNMRRQGRDI